MIIMVVMTGTHPYSPLYDILNVILYTLYYNDIINNHYKPPDAQHHFGAAAGEATLFAPKIFFSFFCI